MSPTKQIRIGVFIPNDAQFMDVATVDAFGSMSQDYLRPLADWFPHVDVATAPFVTILYITTAKHSSGIPLTSNATLKAHHVYTDPEVAPGTLDIIVVPGPNPNGKFEEGALQWLREQFEAPGVDVLSICTGIVVCGEAGIADGRQASGPRLMQDVLVKRFPKVKFVGETRRWVRDGNFWSSGGVTNGNDLVAAYALRSGRFPVDIAEVGLSIVETSDRGEAYDV